MGGTERDMKFQKYHALIPKILVFALILLSSACNLNHNSYTGGISQDDLDMIAAGRDFITALEVRDEDEVKGLLSQELRTFLEVECDVQLIDCITVGGRPLQQSDVYYIGASGSTGVYFEAQYSPTEYTQVTVYLEKENNEWRVTGWNGLAPNP
jgi:hypothetical protein